MNSCMKKHKNNIQKTIQIREETKNMDNKEQEAPDHNPAPYCRGEGFSLQLFAPQPKLVEALPDLHSPSLFRPKLIKYLQSLFPFPMVKPPIYYSSLLLARQALQPTSSNMVEPNARPSPLQSTERQSLSLSLSLFFSQVNKPNLPQPGLTPRQAQHINLQSSG